MLDIKTTGFQDFLDDSANIRALLIGGPGVGKTRWSSFWPRPLLIDAEGNRGSLRDRAMPFVRVTNSKDMLDVLEYLKALNATPKSQRKYQTIVIDTIDSFQRIVKEEWVSANNAGSFSGYDAWGYLDTKMQLLATRLLNLDYNVVVLLHPESKEHKDGENVTREYDIQLQGAIKRQIFNDFGLVGWFGSYWDAGKDGRVEKRGITFKSTPQKPFLKDTFGVMPSYFEVDLTDPSSFQKFLDFFMAELEGNDEIPDQQVVDQVPSADPMARSGGIQQPMEGGALQARGSQLPAEQEVPLEKKLKSELDKIAKDLGIEVRGNTLKAELVKKIQEAQASQASGTESTTSTSDAETPSGAPVEESAPASSESATPTPEADPWTGKPLDSSTESDSASSSNGAESSEAAPQPAENVSAESAEALVAEELGGEVIPEEPADAPETPQPAPPPTATPAAKSGPQGPSACAGCGVDLAPLWATPEGTQHLRKSFIKKRAYLCTDCVNN